MGKHRTELTLRDLFVIINNVTIPLLQVTRFDFSSVQSRGADTLVGPVGQFPYGVRVTIDEFNPVLLDSSLRYNPEWRTFGHVSLSVTSGTLFFSHFINFESQFFRIEPDGLDTYEELGEPIIIQPDDDQQLPVTVRWQFRPSVVASITVIF